MVTFDQAILLGTIVASALATIFGNRLMPAPVEKRSALSPAMAIAGGALADTLGLQQNTEAILKLAASNEALAEARRQGNDISRVQSKIADGILDELIQMRRAVEEAARIAARKP